ncbi:hypothetical protein ANO11243_032000 [Dothideomycetidae sp. 11243]|nr:hypothetical protein ANO11243_032000 [fungal sp. No.11243]
MLARHTCIPFHEGGTFNILTLQPGTTARQSSQLPSPLLLALETAKKEKALKRPNRTTGERAPLGLENRLLPSPKAGSRKQEPYGQQRAVDANEQVVHPPNARSSTTAHQPSTIKQLTVNHGQHIAVAIAIAIAIAI